MAETFDALKNVTPYILGGAAVLATFVRAEFRGRQNAKEISEERVERKTENEKLEARVDQRRKDDNSIVQRDIGRIFEGLQTLSADVKTLLQRGNKEN